MDYQVLLAMVRNRFASGLARQVDRDHLNETLAAAALAPPYGEVLRWSLRRALEFLDRKDLSSAARELHFAHNVPGLGLEPFPAKQEQYFLDACVHDHIEENLTSDEATHLRTLLGPKWRDPVPFGDIDGALESEQGPRNQGGT